MAAGKSHRSFASHHFPLDDRVDTIRDRHPENGVKNYQKEKHNGFQKKKAIKESLSHSS